MQMEKKCLCGGRKPFLHLGDLSLLDKKQKNGKIKPSKPSALKYGDLPDLEILPSHCEPEYSSETVLSFPLPEEDTVLQNSLSEYQEYNGVNGMPELERISENDTSECSSSRDSDLSNLSSSKSGYCKVVITNFPYGISEAELMNLFAPFHPVKCRIMINAPTPIFENVSYAFIYFPNDYFGTAAEEALNRTMYRRNIIEVIRIESS